MEELVLSVDVVGFWYEANREVLGALAGGGRDPRSSNFHINDE